VPPTSGLSIFLDCLTLNKKALGSWPESIINHQSSRRAIVSHIQYFTQQILCQHFTNWQGWITTHFSHTNTATIPFKTWVNYPSSFSTDAC
jgi:hypothetical protein